MKYFIFSLLFLIGSAFAETKKTSESTSSDSAPAKTSTDSTMSGASTGSTQADSTKAGTGTTQTGSATKTDSNQDSSSSTQKATSSSQDSTRSTQSKTNTQTDSTKTETSTDSTQTGSSQENSNPAQGASSSSQDSTKTTQEPANSSQDSTRSTQSETSTQTSSAQEPASSNNDNVEKITVTGSRIKRIDLEGPNPITVYSAKDLELSGYHSVGDFLRNTTLSVFGVDRGTAGSSWSGESFISIKGEPTLLLLNGLRIVEDPDAHEVDLNLIPMNAIERIEVLKNGGSAIYGSDALGGVINFITKKDFSGTELHASVTPTLYPLWRGNFWKGSFWKDSWDNITGKSFWTGGDDGWKEAGIFSVLDDYLAGSSVNAGAVFGSSGTTGADKWSVLGTLNLRYQENVILKQREWGKVLQGYITPEPIFFDLEDTPDTSYCPKVIYGIFCDFDYSPFADFIPKYAQSNLFIQGNYETNNIQFYSQFLGSYKINQYHYAPIPVSFGAKPYLIIPAGHKLSVQGGQDFKMNHRFMEAGRRNTFTHHWLADLTVGAKGYVSKTWDYDVSLKAAHIIKNDTHKNLLLRDKTIEVMQTGKYNPLEPTREGLKEAIYTAKNKNNSTLVFGSADFSGDTGIGFDVATGIQAYWQRYQNKADPQDKADNILSRAGSDGVGNRYVGSYYIEAIQNFQEQFELQLAWRVDYYSDFGFSNFGIRQLAEGFSGNIFEKIQGLELLDYLIGTPKIAFRFQPAPNVMFRGSVGSAFKAPDLSSLYKSSSSSFPRLTDSVACIAQIQENSQEETPITITSGAPPDLIQEVKYEKATDGFSETSLEVLKDKNLLTKLVVYGEDISEYESAENAQKIKTAIPDLKNLQGSYPCNKRQYSVNYNSNKDLQPTQALSASVGSVLELTPDLNINLDLGYIQKNGIASDGLSDIDGKRLFDAEALGKQDLIDKLGIDIERDTNQALKNVTTRMVNLQKSRKLFVDLGLKSMFLNNFYFNNDFTVFLIHKLEDFPELFGLENQIGKFGTPRWINMATVGWKNKKQHIFLNAFSVAPFQRISDASLYFPLSTRFDLSYEYLLSEKTRLNFNLYNFLNLGLNFYNKDEDFFADINFDSPVDMATDAIDDRIDSDIHNIHGAHFNIRLSHLL